MRIETPATPLVVVDGPEELRKRAGEEIGVSEWVDVEQADIDDFAEATGDRFWLHVDPARAARGPVGTTIAHGLFTLSLGPMFTYALVGWRNLGVSLNYGYDRVRLPAPLPVGSRVRMRLRLASVEEAGDGWLVGLEQTFERDGQEKPVCAARQLLRFVPDSSDD